MSLTLVIMLLLLLGMLAGSLSGLLGIGGGLIVVPGLVEIYQLQGMPAHVIMHMAIGTSLAIMILTTLASLIAHLRRGAYVWPVFIKLLPGILIGTIAGALTAHLLHTDVLKILFGLFVLTVAIHMLSGKRPKPQHHLPGPVGMTVMGLLIGGKSGLLGVGGGCFNDSISYTM